MTVLLRPVIQEHQHGFLRSGMEAFGGPFRYRLSIDKFIAAASCGTYEETAPGIDPTRPRTARLRSERVGVAAHIKGSAQRIAPSRSGGV